MLRVPSSIAAAMHVDSDKENSPVNDPVERGIREYRAILAERDELRRQAAHYRTSFENIDRECDIYHQKLGRLEQEKNFYLKLSVELTSKLVSSVDMLNAMVADAKSRAFRPEEAEVQRDAQFHLESEIAKVLPKPKLVSQEAGEPIAEREIPQFLTRPLTEYDDR